MLLIVPVSINGECRARRGSVVVGLHRIRGNDGVRSVEVVRPEKVIPNIGDQVVAERIFSI
jgi:hypothetical protein